MGRMYAYSRITPGDCEEEIRSVMREMQVADGNIYADHVTKKHRALPEYGKLLKKLEKGDLLYISGLSCLGDSYAEVKEQWRLLTREKKVDVIVLDMPTVDTRKGKAQYGLLVADLVYSLLDYITENDNNVRKSRQREGIAQAKQMGIKFGRPPKPMPDNFFHIYNRWVSREITAAEAAKLCKVSRTVFYRKVKEVRGSMKDDG
ncbi:MAG: recombinase family protein [Lachnospiraceae bacterium]|nr:recombinase family protein [Lachnospiraceae bacterium]